MDNLVGVLLTPPQEGLRVDAPQATELLGPWNPALGAQGHDGLGWGLDDVGDLHGCQFRQPQQVFHTVGVGYLRDFGRKLRLRGLLPLSGATNLTRDDFHDPCVPITQGLGPDQGNVRGLLRLNVLKDGDVSPPTAQCPEPIRAPVVASRRQLRLRRLLIIVLQADVVLVLRPQFFHRVAHTRLPSCGPLTANLTTLEHDARQHWAGRGWFVFLPCMRGPTPNASRKSSGK